MQFYGNFDFYAKLNETGTEIDDDNRKTKIRIIPSQTAGDLEKVVS